MGTVKRKLSERCEFLLARALRQRVKPYPAVSLFSCRASRSKHDADRLLHALEDPRGTSGWCPSGEQSTTQISEHVSRKSARISRSPGR